MLVDNNILSPLAKIERLELLPALFDQVGTVPSVLDELHRDEVAGYQFVERIDAVKSYRGGWLQVYSPTESEVQLADDIINASLSFTDAECVAVAAARDERLLTDDGHAAEMASQRDVEVWDLKLLLEAALVKGHIETESELETVIDALRERDGYRFSNQDRTDLFDHL
ncbi:hypothetical protein [Halarchaeum nitratireducens]|uniref:PIN domain-containing protein n=1 Tax=Halarchaeum nitratireducens TaxID=489913 RepID=A0A830GDQ0_9EURY|nr:hypothetical protein [Halarchaeum nitratireducens]GGN24146.1 hypothetical protein GCM10009021_27360 [Halarchaeum nitratireducens]